MINFMRAGGTTSVRATAATSASDGSVARGDAVLADLALNRSPRPVF